MAHGGYRKHKVVGKRTGSGSKGLGAKQPLDKTKLKKRTKMASIKNQIRAIERLLKKGLPAEAQDVQNRRLEDLKKQAEGHQRAELERKMSLRYRGVKFFERKKIERRIKRLEKLLESTNVSDPATVEQKSVIIEQLAQLKEDLEYVRFFPRTEKYVSLFMGNEDEEVIAKRNTLREQIKANLAAAAASGVEPEEMDSDEGQAMAVSDDEFFLAGSDDGETEDLFASTSSKPGFRDHIKKNTAKFSANRTSGHMQQGPHKRPQNTGVSPKIYKQRPVTMLKSKGSGQEDKRHYATGAGNNKKRSWSKGQIQHQSMVGDNKIKENIVSQKLKKSKIVSPLSNLPSSYRESLQARHPSTSNTASQTPSSLILPKNNVHSSNFPSRSKAEAVKAPTSPEIGSSNMDVQKKRRRKHRPKKKKT